MLVSFFESIKYVGHFWPIVFLRIYTGYYFLGQALTKIRGDFLERPIVVTSISEWVPSSSAPEWYKSLMETMVPAHWQIFSYLVVCLLLFVGVSYLIGYMVRMASLAGLFLCLNGLLVSHLAQLPFEQLMLAVVVTLGWVGAGRCLGLDYFFYKKRRGLWW
mgnify:CR=1 FL=1